MLEIFFFRRQKWKEFFFVLRQLPDTMYGTFQGTSRPRTFLPCMSIIFLAVLTNREKRKYNKFLFFFAIKKNSYAISHLKHIQYTYIYIYIVDFSSTLIFFYWTKMSAILYTSITSRSTSITQAQTANCVLCWIFSSKIKDGFECFLHEPKFRVEHLLLLNIKPEL